MPRVSIIVPVYQVEAYLPACLDSILAQSFADFELILVDDGTRDGSCRIMSEYARKDRRIREIHKQNGGLSSARNAGLEIAEGELVAFVDSDDTGTPDFLEKTVNAMEGQDLVLFNYRKVYEDGREDPPFLPIRDEEIDLSQMGLARYFYDYWLPYIHGQEAWCRLYRRSILEEHRLRYAPNNEIFAEDTLFSAMLLMHVRRIRAMSGCYIRYLQRDASLMGAPKPQLAARLMELSVRLSRYVRETGHERELRNVIPVLCYDKLICKGIRLDPSRADVELAMQRYREEEEMIRILRALEGPEAFTAYLFRTHKGIRTQIRGRLFARAWRTGDIRKALSLVEESP